MKMSTFAILPFYIFISVLSLAHPGCTKDKQQKAVLQDLFKTYRDGEISECKLNGKTVYSAGINAFDAPSYIYDENGLKTATCNYAFGMVDPDCNSLKNCEVIYRCKGHISGGLPINKYNLK